MARTAVSNRIRILANNIEVTDNADSLDFTGGGVTLSAIGNAVSVAIPGVTGSFSILSATGTINDTNQAFTFAQRPAIIVMNGISYRDGATTGSVVAWTWSGSTATMFAPVGTGNSIYGIV